MTRPDVADVLTAGPTTGPTAAETIDVLRQQVEALGAEVEHLGRLAVLGTLAATLAHEFNNILTPAASYARLGEQALKDAEPSPADLALARKALVKCSAASTRAGRLCEAILGFAKPTGTAADATPLAEVVHRALASLGRSPEQDLIRTKLEIDDSLRVAIDGLQLEHVLVNLLLNARRALLEMPASRRRLEITARSKGGQVDVAVRDTGCGIDGETLPRIFEPFVRGQSSGEGSGLGLSLCRRIIERHGGRINAESTPGQGSTFHLSLPAAA